MNTELFGELHEQEEYGLFGKEHERSRLIIEFTAEPKRWRGYVGDNYYFVSNGDVHADREDCFFQDDERYESNNYFETYEEAEAELKRRELE